MNNQLHAFKVLGSYVMGNKESNWHGQNYSKISWSQSVCYLEVPLYWVYSDIHF